MPTQATYDDANLILKLYELRREEKLRAARDWFGANFFVADLEEMNRVAPPGSDGNTYMRMVASYWDLVCSFVTSGVLNQELLFQTSGEMLVVWERIRPLLPTMRQMFDMPIMFQNLETVGNAYIEYLKSKKSYDGFAKMVNTRPPGK